MATNDAVAAYTGQLQAASNEYKNAWANAPAAGGAGQFPSTAPFKDAASGLTATPLQNAASTIAQTKPMQATGPIDALPTTPTGPTATTPIADDPSTVSNFTAEKPYVQDVTDSGEVGRQAVRPERLAIDDTMSQEEQYRRAWQNEANGYYGNEVARTAAPAPAPATAAAPAAAPAPAAPVEYGISYQGGTDASDLIATVYDKATGQTVQQFDAGKSGELYNRLGGVGSVNSDQLKQYAGWSAPSPTTGAGA